MPRKRSLQTGLGDRAPVRDTALVFFRNWNGPPRRSLEVSRLLSCAYARYIRDQMHVHAPKITIKFTSFLYLCYYYHIYIYVQHFSLCAYISNKKLYMQ